MRDLDAHCLYIRASAANRHKLTPCRSRTVGDIHSAMVDRESAF